ncbi:MAG: DUF1294 domain-containing protein [Clostridia bacterium]|nr:DUF1294 domain-containing protein [Clostridia bacterium]
MAIFEAIGRFFLDYPLVPIALLLVMNLVSLVAYYADKQKAKKGTWRTPEATLIALAWAFGSIGALVGMYGFRHKTKHIKFIILVPLAFIVHLLLFAVSLIAAL